MLPARRGLLVGCDFDGTLSRIRARPGQVRPLPGALAILRALAAQPGLHLALVSGRDEASLRRLCPVPGGHYIGSHGNEGSAMARPAFDAVALERIRSELGVLADQWPGSWLELKPISVALHFREAADSSAATIEAVCRRLANRHRWHLQPGRRVFEFLPPGTRTKAQALLLLRRKLGCGTMFYFGDDATDETVFRLRIQSFIGVKVRNGETSHQPTAAKYILLGPQEVVPALRMLLHLQTGV